MALSTPPSINASNGKPEEVHEDDNIRLSSDTNERLADMIQKEKSFRLRRMPEHIIINVGVVNLILAFLQLLLIISNNVGTLGLWKGFIEISTGYREDFRSTSIARAIKLDSEHLNPLSLWRGWVVPSFLAGSIYIVTAMLALRHELFHWKPELLELYFNQARTSSFGRLIPYSWLDRLFKVYKQQHGRYASARIQRRKHNALEDAKQMAKILRTVALNLFISVVGVLVLWIVLLQTKIESEDVATLPRSYVPLPQAIVWYAINDFFYFYPHWIAHTPDIANRLPFKLLPRSVADGLHHIFNKWHKTHHRTKVNLGIAAWYCSPWEQIAFNLFPAFIGPVATQLLADACGLEHIWGTHLVTLYLWLMSASSSSVLAHTGYRSRWNDPGKHDLHHERAFDPRKAVNFGTLGLFDWLHGTASSIPAVDSRAWKSQRDRQAALHEASKRSGIPLSIDQMKIIQQPDHSDEWAGKSI
jgi:sterol desaturase/sphingolipid hydroxylase (fatty acid hydroxylase superfamily)